MTAKLLTADAERTTAPHLTFALPVFVQSNQIILATHFYSMVQFFFILLERGRKGESATCERVLRSESSCAKQERGAGYCLAKGRRRDLRNRGEVLRQSCERHRFGDHPDRCQFRTLGIWAATHACLRLRRGQRAIRPGLVPWLAADQSQNRQRIAALR